MALKGLAEKQKSAALPTLDPENRDWARGAAENPATVSRKRRRDRQRVRMFVDVSPQLKAALEHIAGWEHGEDTSVSQVAEMLLLFGALAYQRADADLLAAFAEGKTHARTPRFTWNLEAPETWETVLDSFVSNGKDGGNNSGKV